MGVDGYSIINHSENCAPVDTITLQGNYRQSKYTKNKYSQVKNLVIHIMWMTG